MSLVLLNESDEMEFLYKMEELSLNEKMNKSYNLALDIIYEDDDCCKIRKLNISDKDDSLLHCWVDGLYHKYAENMITCRCSLQAAIDFDVEKFEVMVDKHLSLFQSILNKIKGKKEI